MALLEPNKNTDQEMHHTAHSWAEIAGMFTSSFCFVGFKVTFNAAIKLNNFSNVNGLMYDSENGIEIPDLKGAELGISSYGQNDTQGYNIEVYGCRNCRN